jgi:hypothetical protein
VPGLAHLRVALALHYDAAMMMTRWLLLLSVTSLAVSACATDLDTDDEDIYDEGGKADRATVSPLIGVWLPNTTARNGEIHTLTVYLRGTFRKKPAYNLSLQTISSTGSRSEIDWGYLMADNTLLSFDSRSRPMPTATVPPPAIEFSVLGTGDARVLTLSDGETDRTYRLDMGARCGSGLPRCVGGHDCKAGWCVEQHSFL